MHLSTLLKAAKALAKSSWSKITRTCHWRRATPLKQSSCVKNRAQNPKTILKISIIPSSAQTMRQPQSRPRHTHTPTTIPNRAPALQSATTRTAKITGPIITVTLPYTTGPDTTYPMSITNQPYVTRVFPKANT
jgi:hypothetical protein